MAGSLREQILEILVALAKGDQFVSLLEIDVLHHPQDDSARELYAYDWLGDALVLEEDGARA